MNDHPLAIEKIKIKPTYVLFDYCENIITSGQINYNNYLFYFFYTVINRREKHSQPLILSIYLNTTLLIC